MLRFFLDRIFAKDRLLQIDLFLSDGDLDPVEASQRIFDAATRGQVTPSEGLAFMEMLEAHGRIMKFVEFDERLEQFEKALRDLQKLNPEKPR